MVGACVEDAVLAAVELPCATRFPKSSENKLVSATAAAALGPRPGFLSGNGGGAATLEGKGLLLMSGTADLFTMTSGSDESQ